MLRIMMLCLMRGRKINKERVCKGEENSKFICLKTIADYEHYYF
jgi:hypothetical protein